MRGNTQKQVTGTISAPVTVIRPLRGWVPIQLGDLWKYRELIYFLTWREIKVRYKQTVLGFAWAIIQPFMIWTFPGNILNSGLYRLGIAIVVHDRVIDRHDITFHVISGHSFGQTSGGQRKGVLLMPLPWQIEKRQPREG